MNKTKLFITFTILFITVGIAAVATSFAINGSTLLANNPDDFRVYFYSVTSNPIEDTKINIISDTAFSFESTLLEVGDYVQIDFGIINSSSNYDADVSMSCTGGNDYVSLDYTLQNNIVYANSDGQGIIFVSLVKSYAGEESFDHYIYCELNATAIERDSLKGNDVPPALVKTFNVGDEITLGTEKFNIIRDNGDGTVTMLSKYNINDKAPYNQTKELMWLKFSDTSGWDYLSGPSDIDVQIWGGNSKRYLNLYVAFLENLVGDNNISGNLITLKELNDLGCDVPLDNKADGVSQYDCLDSEHIDWLANGQMWWTRSSSTGNPDKIWRSTDEGIFYTSSYNIPFPVRPTITISKETIINFEKLRIYNIGDEVSIGEEKFNVISDNGTTVSMLAKYNLGTDYKQVKGQNYVSFSDNIGWVNSPGPKEIDIQNHDGNAKTYINEYVEYLIEITQSVSISGDLITLKELNSLGCLISSDYSWLINIEDRTCNNSIHKLWLVDSYNNWWTKSANPDFSERIYIVVKEGYIKNTYNDNAIASIRPVITISKENLK